MNAPFDRPLGAAPHLQPGVHVGRPLPRPNAKRLVAGRGNYVTDMKLPRMLHAAFVRSPFAHARIVRIDVEAARAAPGVALVATGEDLAKLCTPWVGTLDHFKGMKSEPQRPLPLDRVTWSGQAVVAVVAESRAAAEDACELVEVEYEDLPVLADLDASPCRSQPRRAVPLPNDQLPSTTLVVIARFERTTRPYLCGGEPNLEPPLSVAASRASSASG